MIGWWVAATLLSLTLSSRASAQPRSEARDGAELWRFERDYFVPRAITADGQRVVVEHNLSVDHHTMLLLDAADGGVVADLSPTFRPSSTLWPIAACGSVLVATLGSQPWSIAGIDAARGNVRWRARGERTRRGIPSRMARRRTGAAGR
ncbi:MAG: hypothetical protein IT379_30175 [Deltaproteobacteria bacterium]|nr:hypothetical protein [Deltaproteobacteria bacterium]